jgi:hypothetical protein
MRSFTETNSRIGWIMALTHWDWIDCYRKSCYNTHMKQYIIEFVQAAVIAAVIAFPFALYFYNMTP